MCACARENNPAPNLATLLQGTASTPAVVIDSSPSPGGRGHGRAPDPTRRPPRTQNGPTRRADTRAGNQRDRIAVQGVAADPSASRAGRASAVLDEPPRCREPRGARTRHRRARHAGPPAREQRGSRPPVAPGSSPPRRALATASPGRVGAAEARIASGSGLFRTAARRGWRGRTAARSRTCERRRAGTQPRLLLHRRGWHAGVRGRAAAGRRRARQTSPAPPHGGGRRGRVDAPASRPGPGLPPPGREAGDQEPGPGGGGGGRERRGPPDVAPPLHPRQRGRGERRRPALALDAAPRGARVRRGAGGGESRRGRGRPGARGVGGAVGGRHGHARAGGGHRGVRPRPRTRRRRFQLAGYARA